MALLRSKLQEHRLKETVQHVVKEGDPIAFGPFELEFVAVNHSIPDALAVAIRTGAGLVLHTGDFKMDQLPLDGPVADLRAFARLGEEGVGLLMVDSTNAEVPGFTTSEGEIGPVLDRVFPGSPSGSSSPASPPTCTGSSRCWTPLWPTAARSPTSDARWSATWRSPVSWATSTVPPTPWSTAARSPTRPSRSC